MYTVYTVGSFVNSHAAGNTSWMYSMNDMRAEKNELRNESWMTLCDRKSAHMYEMYKMGHWNWKT